MATQRLELLDNTRPNLRAAGYLRVSTEDQLLGHGLAYTERKVKDYASRKGWGYVQTFADEGVSGTLPAEERPDLSRLIEHVHRTPRPFDVVAVVEGRQIGRNGRAFWPWVWRLEDLGVFTAITSLQIDNTTERGRDAMREEADYAEREWNRLRRRLQGGIQEAAELGGYPGGTIPFGWHAPKLEKGKLTRYEIHIKEAACIRRAAELYLFERSWERTARMLNAEGHRTRGDALWTRKNLKMRMLGHAIQSNEVIWRGKGALVDHAGEPVFGRQVVIKLPVILDADTARALRETPARKTWRQPERFRVYSLTGLMTSQCGRRYSGTNRRDDYYDYVCSGRSLPFGERCKCRPVPAEDTENRVWSEVRQLVTDADRMESMARDWLSAAPEVDYASRIDDLTQQIEQQEAAIAASTAVAAKMAAARGLLGQDAERAVEKTTTPLFRELEDLEKLRREAQGWLRDRQEAAERLETLRAMADKARSRLGSLGPAEQAEMLSLFGVRVRVLEPPASRRGVPCDLRAWFVEHKRDVPVLSDAAWVRAWPILCVPQLTEEHGRLLLGAMLYKAANGGRWVDIGPRFGARGGRLQVAAHRWRKSGRWDRVMEALRGLPAVPVWSGPPARLEITVRPLGEFSSEDGECSGCSWGSRCRSRCARRSPAVRSRPISAAPWRRSS
ncbi:recombinase family protein [Streptomyces sp. MP131-18]|uniref:recombinase family protein n=1 Tax=Streptomyces sp. MP131-18 TaxID=1857892 RepID=UPI00097C0A9D|nr:recombinase family protein [Streptomyces sp. MP131-18]ONK10409.1 Transposase [Streptomyces sp. MP131-18]